MRVRNGCTHDRMSWLGAAPGRELRRARGSVIPRTAVSSTCLAWRRTCADCSSNMTPPRCVVATNDDGTHGIAPSHLRRSRRGNRHSLGESSQSLAIENAQFPTLEGEDARPFSRLEHAVHRLADGAGHSGEVVLAEPDGFVTVRLRQHEETPANPL